MADNRTTNKEFKPGITAYNAGGYEPVKSVFMLDVDQMKKMVLTVAKAHLDDIETVTFAADRDGNVTTFVWLNRNSSHLCDTSVTKGSSLVTTPISRYSPELKEFINRFCAKDKKQVMRDAIGSRPLKAIVVELSRFIAIMFDERGDEYGKVYNARRQRCDISYRWSFREGRHSKFEVIDYAEITKSVRGTDREREPKAAVPAGRFGN